MIIIGFLTQIKAGPLSYKVIKDGPEYSVQYRMHSF